MGIHLFPAAARALIEQMKTITDKPVRYIVSTHYHASPTAARETFPAGIEAHRPRRWLAAHLSIHGLASRSCAGSNRRPP